MTTLYDEHYMREALAEAKIALEDDILPVGAVLVVNGEVVGRAHKLDREGRLKHAETRLILTHWDGDQKPFEPNQKVELFTTLEPCSMCMGLAMHVFVQRVIYAMPDSYGGCAHFANTAVPRHMQRPVAVTGGVLQEDARALFAQFLTTTKHKFWASDGAPELQRDVLGERDTERGAA